MRIGTWNMKQAVAPKKPLPELWRWMATTMAPDVVVLTEAKVPKTGAPDGWSALWKSDGIDDKRRWATVLAGRGVDLTPITRVRRRELEYRWPGTVQAAEVSRNGKLWGAVIGIYGLTLDEAGVNVKHGRRSTPLILDEIAPIVRAYERVVVAGDLNLWPCDKPKGFERLGLIDVIEYTAADREPLSRCSGCTKGANCGHMWTHRNGSSSNAAVQQIDYIFANRPAIKQLVSVTGGIADFPDAWEVSDHAPVVAEFEV